MNPEIRLVPEKVPPMILNFAIHKTRTHRQSSFHKLPQSAYIITCNNAIIIKTYLQKKGRHSHPKPPSLLDQYVGPTVYKYHYC